MNHKNLTGFLVGLEGEANVSSLWRALVVVGRAEEWSGLKCLVWCLVNTAVEDPAFFARLTESLDPSEESMGILCESLAHDSALFEVLRMPASKQKVIRLMRMADLMRLSSDSHVEIALAPMTAYLAEQQLKQLIEATESRSNWTNPIRILDPDQKIGVNVGALLLLAEAQDQVRSSPALVETIFRLRGYLEKHKKELPRHVN